tara:strand:+ start:273 stop:698 length:426 start_codon:yes stop_codon:yes gene_type:complete
MWQRIRNGLVSGIVLGIALATLAVIGIGFLLAGCYLALAAQIGPAGAALAVGAGALALVGLALALALRRGAAPRRARATHAATASSASQDELLTRTGVELAESLAANPRQAALLAFGIGVVLGVSPKARDILNEVVAGTQR